MYMAVKRPCPSRLHEPPVVCVVGDCTRHPLPEAALSWRHDCSGPSATILSH